MAANSNLLTRVAEFAADVFRMAQTRVEMLGVELQRERDLLVQQLKLAMFSVVAGGLASLCAVLWVAVALPAPLRNVLLGVLMLVFLVACFGAAALARRQRSQHRQALGNVVAQLRRDQVTMRGHDPDASQTDQGSHDELSRDARQVA